MCNLRVNRSKTITALSFTIWYNNIEHLARCIKKCQQILKFYRCSTTIMYDIDAGVESHFDHNFSQVHLLFIESYCLVF